MLPVLCVITCSYGLSGVLVCSITVKNHMTKASLIRENDLIEGLLTVQRFSPFSPWWSMAASIALEQQVRATGIAERWEDKGCVRERETLDLAWAVEPRSPPPTTYFLQGDLIESF